MTKKTIRNTALFAILVVALYLLLPQLVDAEKTLELIADANYWLVALALVLEVAAILSYANLTRFILRILGIHMRLVEVLSVTLSGLAVSHLLSAGGVGGWVVTYNALMKRKVPHGLIFVAIAAQQFFNYIVLWFVFALALIYLVVGRGESIIAYGAGILLIILLLWLTAYGFYLYYHRTRMRRRLGQLADLVNRVAHRCVIDASNIDGWLDNLFAGMRRMASHRGAVRRTSFYAAGFWFFDLLCLYFVFLAFDYHMSIGLVAVAYIVAYAVGTLAPTPGGLGAIEGLLIALFVSFGVASTTAVTVVLAYRLLNFWLPIIPGLVAYTVGKPGRSPVTEGEIEHAAEEECVLHPAAIAGAYKRGESADADCDDPPRSRATQRGRSKSSRARQPFSAAPWFETWRRGADNGGSGSNGARSDDGRVSRRTVGGDASRPAGVKNDDSGHRRR